MSFAGIGFEHAVADKAEAHAGHHRDLADGAAHLECGCQHVSRRFPGVDHFQQAHDVGRAEKMQADHILRTGGHGSDQVDVQGRGVGRQNGAGLAHEVEAAEHLLLDL
ncbi:hypothetical protein D3C73_1166230 [compost metagenome]